MKNYLSSLDLAMWIAFFVGQVVLCLCILKRRFSQRLRWFSIFIFFATGKDAFLFALAFWSSYPAYYYAYYAGSYIESVLVFVTLIECGRRVLPGLNLPQKEQAFSYLFGALAAVLIFVYYWPLNFLENRIDVGAYLCVAITFIFIAAYSRYLGLYWSRLLAGITATLGSLYLVEGVARAVVGHYPPAMGAQVREISQIANVLAVIAWIIVILSPWGESVMTEEDLQILEAAFAKIEDSLGAERVKAI